jgi:hypothetical protein
MESTNEPDFRWVPDDPSRAGVDDILEAHNRMAEYCIPFDVHVPDPNQGVRIGDFFKEPADAGVLPADGVDDRPAGNPADPEVQQVWPVGRVFLPEDDPDGEG